MSGSQPINTTEVSAKSLFVVTQHEHGPAQLVERAKQLYQNEQYIEAIRVWQQAVAVFQQRGDLLNQGMALSNLAVAQQKLGNITAAEKAIAFNLELLQNQPANAIRQSILANTLDIPIPSSKKGQRK